jgi:L-fuconolactonase
LDRWGQEAKFRGVRMRFEGHKDANILKRPSVIEGLKEVSRRGLVFDFLVTVEQLAGILKVYEDVPELKGVIEHLAKPDMADKKDLTQWQETMQKLAAQTSVMCKLSLSPRADQMRSLLSHPSCGWSLEKIRPYVRFMVDHFGCDRLMWGSDWPICLVMSDYQGTWQVMDQILAGVTEEEKDKVYGRNAISFYRLTAERKTK